MQIAEEAGYWKDVLKRIVSTVVFIAERGLAFRGSDENVGSPHNGNYLGILELIAEFDPFLAGHIKEHGNKGKGHVNYLSSTVCEEVIDILGEKVLDEIVSRLKKAKYYSVSVDSTPDESHIDQLTVVVRYVEGMIPVERFLTFIPNSGHKGEELAETLLSYLQKKGIAICDARGQSYDNAPNMGGKYNGMQALVLKKNPLAVHIPCCAHSLNLVGKAAANSCSDAVLFFSFMEQLFVFFTNSTSRYQILISKLSASCKSKNEFYILKRLSDTRWSCRADAAKALFVGYLPIIEALRSICDNGEEKDIVRNEARGLLRTMYRLETAVYAKFWYEILERFNATNKDLQSPQMTLNTAVKSLEALKSFVSSKRDKFDEYETAGQQLSKTETYETGRTKTPSVTRQPLDYGQTPASSLSPREKFRTESFVSVIDQMIVSLTQRIAAYSVVCARFGFLANLENLTDDEVGIAAQNLVNNYPDDLESSLGNEFVQLKAFSKHCEKNEKETTELFLYRVIMENDLKCTFMNSEIALRMYLSLMVSNCEDERSFSKLKIIKNRLRTSMLQDRLVNLTRMSIENDILRECNFDNIVEVLANKKARKHHF